LSKFEARRWQKGDFEQWETWHRKYHDALIAACGSPTLLQFCAVLFDMRDRYRRLFLKILQPNREVAKEHAELTEATLARDAQRACALLERHIERNGRVILGAIKE
jgi:DNA-binding GntR family transcriptional regulator